MSIESFIEEFKTFNYTEKKLIVQFITLEEREIVEETLNIINNETDLELCKKCKKLDYSLYIDICECGNNFCRKCFKFKAGLDYYCSQKCFNEYNDFW